MIFHDTDTKDTAQANGFDSQEIESNADEARLIMGDANYRSLLDRVPVGLYWATPQGEILDVNQAFLALLGYPDRHSALSENMTSWYEDQENWESFLARVAVVGTALAEETQLQRQDGSTVWVKHIVQAISDADGLVTHFEGVLEDLRTQKAADARLQQYASQMARLHQTTEAISASFSLEEVFELILTQIEAVLPVNGGIILLRRAQELRVALDRGIHPSLLGKRFPLTEGFFKQISEGKDLIILNNPGELADFKEWRGMTEVQSWLGAPLVVRGEFLGCMCLESKHSGAYQSDQFPLIKAFAAQTAQALDNARLVRDAKRRLDRLASLRKIDRAISNSLDLGITLNVILHQVIEQLVVDAAVILVYQQENQTLDFLAGQGFRTKALQFTRLRLGQGQAGSAALKRECVFIPDLDQQKTSFIRSPQFQEEGFQSYYGIPLIAKGEIIGVLEIFHRRRLQPDTEWQAFAETLAGQAAIAIDNIHLFDKLRQSNLEIVQAYDMTIEGWARALELRDLETEGHSWRVMVQTLELARQIKVHESTLIHLRRGALLHDIGKIGVPDKILQKPGPLDDREWEIMHKHPVYAYEWLSSIQYLRPALDIPYCHHEKWDGSGYPRGLKGEQIPLAARIFAVVDVYDALRSDRPYRSAWDDAKARRYIQEQSGAHFDPQVVNAFFRMI